MNKALKYILIILGSFILLFAAAVVVITLVVDPNDYRGKISQLVKENTGRDLAIGNIDLSVFPWLGLELTQVSLSNAPGFGEMPFAALEQAEVRVKLIPLLKKNLEVKTIRLQGVDLNLVKNKQGVTNWDDLTGKNTSGGESTARESQDSRSDSSPLAGLAVGGLEIRNASVSWQDNQAGTSYSLSDLSLTVGTIHPPDPFDLELSFAVSSKEPQADLTVALAARAVVAQSLDRFTLDDCTLEVTATGAGVPGGRAEVVVDADIGLDMAKESLAVQELMLTAYELSLSGGISGSKVLSAPSFQGELTLEESNPRDVLAALGQPGIKTSDPDVLQKLMARVVFAATTSSVHLDSLAATLDDTTLKGTAGVPSFDGPAVVFDLNVDGIDVDRYLPPAKDAPQSEQPGQKPETSTTPGLPLEPLRTLDLKGKAALGKLKVKNIKVSDISLTVTSKNGVLTIDPALATLYEGSFKAFSRLDARRDAPSFEVRKSLNNVQVGPLLKDLAGKDVLSGTGQIKASLTTSGLTPEEMKQNLDGDAALKFLDGAVYGINIPKLIRDGVMQLKGQQPDPAAVEKTDFAELSGTATITKGLVQNRDLLLYSPLIRITGTGDAHLARETVDYLLRTKVVGTLEGQGGREMTELTGLTVPIRITGTFAQPKIRPEFKELLPALGLEKGKQILEERKKEIQKDIGKQLFGDTAEGGGNASESPAVEPEKLLKGLFGRE